MPILLIILRCLKRSDEKQQTYPLIVSYPSVSIGVSQPESFPLNPPQRQIKERKKKHAVVILGLLIRCACANSPATPP